jgi:gentisate 1,2-dioxygenase
MRTEMHRLRPGAASGTRRTVGSAVWQVFRGSGTAELAQRRFRLTEGDLITVPSWAPLRFEAETQLDLFTFSDHRIYEALHLDREETVGQVQR